MTDIITQQHFTALCRGFTLFGLDRRVNVKWDEDADQFVFSHPNKTTHRLAVSCTDRERLNAHWNGYSEQPLSNPMRRRIGVLTLTLDPMAGPIVKWFRFSASLACAANEGVLHHEDGREWELSEEEQEVVDNWEILYADFEYSNE